MSSDGLVRDYREPLSRRVRQGTNCCQERLLGATVYVSATPDYTASGSWDACGPVDGANDMRTEAAPTVMRRGGTCGQCIPGLMI